MTTGRIWTRIHDPLKFIGRDGSCIYLPVFRITVYAIFNLYCLLH